MRQDSDYGADKPVISPINEFYWNAYWDLNSCRNMGGVIAWSEIERYANKYGHGNKLDFFIHIIRSLDNAHCKPSKP